MSALARLSFAARCAWPRHGPANPQAQQPVENLQGSRHPRTARWGRFFGIGI
jgi:hypothetical protein